jgi:mono/diheme cytochrome c family protein
MPYVLMIRERHNFSAGRSPIANTHATWEEAHAELVAYVRENWDARMDQDPPQDDEDELIVQYFEQTLEEYDTAETANTAST